MYFTKQYDKHSIFCRDDISLILFLKNYKFNIHTSLDRTLYVISSTTIETTLMKQVYRNEVFPVEKVQCATSIVFSIKFGTQSYYFFLHKLKQMRN